MRCVVTGVAGFVGSSLAEELLRQGHSVLGIDCFTDYYARDLKLNNLTQAQQNSQFKFVEADLSQADLRELLGGSEAIFHQAAQAGVRASWGSTFKSYTSHNILGTQSLLEACKGISSLKRVVYASSSSIYGNAESFPTREDTLPAPISPYGVSKLAAEHLMMLYQSEFGVPTISLRYFTVYGPRQRPDMAFNRWIRQALRKQPITLYGDGTQSRDFTFISDIVAANIAAVTKGQAGHAYNLGGGTQASVNSVLEMLREIIGPISIERSGRQSGDAKHTSADTTQAQQDLGFIPQVSLRDGIQAETAWMEGILSGPLGKSLP